MRPSPDRVALAYLTRKTAASTTGRISVGPAFEIVVWYDAPASMGFLHTMMKSVEGAQKDVNTALAGTAFASLLRWNDPVIVGDKDGLSVRLSTGTSRGFQALREDKEAWMALQGVARRHGYKLS